MANITAADVMKLRKMTSAGMMDCKKALEEAEGDFQKAADIIREKGKLVAAKRADRETSEGAVKARIQGGKGILVCLGCETDFVSRNSDFQGLADAIADVAIAKFPADKEALLACELPDGTTVEKAIEIQTGKSGEKTVIAYYAPVEAPFVAQYIHTLTGKLGALVGFNKEVPADLAKGVVMQVASMSPVAISEADCPKEVVENELKVAVEKTKEEQVQKAVEAALKKAGINPALVNSEEHIESNIAKKWLTPEQADQAREIIKTVGAEKAANLNEQMIQNIAKGRLAKFFKENTLEAQEYQMGDGKMSVKEAIAAVDKEAKVVVFKKFNLND
jgi:elongation factor Ts